MNNDLDIQVVDQTSVDDETTQMIMFAKLAAQTLSQHYPNHLWAVGWAPGMTIIVKNMAISDGRYGFTIDVPRAHSISHFEKVVMQAGGELLERCGVPRGSWNGEFMHLQHKEH